MRLRELILPAAGLSVLVTVGFFGTRDPGTAPAPRSQLGSPPEHRRPERAAPDAAIQLVLAPPTEWPAAIDRVRSEGPSTVPALIRALERFPGADGAQAVVAVLGDLGGDEARAELQRRLVDPDARLATEAAIGLGFCGTESDRDRLVELAEDQARPVRVRAAGACSALRLRPGADLHPLIEGLWLAGSDRRVDLREQLGLPDQTRWAYERLLVADAVRAVAPELAADLDPDSSWPDLEAQIRPLLTWLDQR